MTDSSYDASSRKPRFVDRALLVAFLGMVFFPSFGFFIIGKGLTYWTYTAATGIALAGVGIALLKSSALFEWLWMFNDERSRRRLGAWDMNPENLHSFAKTTAPWIFIIWGAATVALSIYATAIL